MKLDEVIASGGKNLLYLTPFYGWRKIYGLTGKYYYDSILDTKKESSIVVEIYTLPFWCGKKYVPLSSLKAIETFSI